MASGFCVSVIIVLLSEDKILEDGGIFQKQICCHKREEEKELTKHQLSC